MKKDLDDTTALVYGDMVRRMKALKNWGSYKTVSEFVHEAIRLHLQEQEARALHEIEEREEPGPLRPSSKKRSS